MTESRGMLKPFLLWLALCLGLALINIGNFYSPFLRTHTPPAILGLAIGLAVWGVPWAIAKRQPVDILLFGVVLSFGTIERFRDILVSTAVLSPVTVLISATGTFGYLLVQSRKVLRR